MNQRTSRPGTGTLVIEDSGLHDSSRPMENKVYIAKPRTQVNLAISRLPVCLRWGENHSMSGFALSDPNRSAVVSVQASEKLSIGTQVSISSSGAQTRKATVTGCVRSQNSGVIKANPHPYILTLALIAT